MPKQSSLLNILKNCSFKRKPATMTIVIGALLCTLSISCMPRYSIKPFSNDNCSCYPEGTADNKNLWKHCCVSHDSAYWQGGSYQDRLHADSILAEWVQLADSKRRAAMMYYGVRIGGTPFLPTPFRWGYGWPYMRGYKKLTLEEIEYINESMLQK